MTKENSEPKAKLTLVKALRSTIGSSAVKARQKNSTAPTTMMMAQMNTASSCSQSWFGPSSSTYSMRAEERRHAGKAPPVELAEQAEIGLVEVDQRPGGAVTRMPGTTLIRNSQCQDMAWLI